VEETGFCVEVFEFLGAITYLAGGRPKVVQFWLMQAASLPSYEGTKDIVAVEWLSLAAAVKRLSHPLERLFLANVGRYAVLQHRRPKRREAKAAVTKSGLQRRRQIRRAGATRP
jgi:8-oxo-dGTP diphosphatase